jgi:hypothetical protein|eukprot:COSAG06_NODE_735_length_12697_cov_9.204398_9_plen_97_part_00
MVLATICVCIFEVASFFFSWALGRTQKWGEYLNMFTAVNSDIMEYQKELGLLWWDRPPAGLLGLSLLFKTVFFLATVVVLMNLLIGAPAPRVFACV